VVATADELVTRARNDTGLDDLGPDGWQDGLAHLLDATERDVHDDDAAVAQIEAIVAARLTTRLRIEDWYAHHAAEAEPAVRAPLMILGLPRTATTALHHLLASDPQFRHLRSWEVKDPVPPPDLATEADDPRRPRQPPAADVRHIATIDGPAEDWPIHALAFDHAELTLPVPSHSDWWRDSRHDSLYPYLDRVLCMLHSRRPPHRWLLKMPAYLFSLPELVAQHPDAVLVMTHRDPVDAIASTCSTVADSRTKRTPTWSPDAEFGHRLLTHWADGMTQALAARDASGAIPVLDVGQREIESDPVRAAARIYEFAGFELSIGVETAMATWAAGNRRGSRGAHRYSPEQYGLDATEITDAFAPYLERFAAYCE
jgi:hypothetical protein